MGPRTGGYQWQVGNQVPESDPEGGWDGFITDKDFRDYKDAGFTMLYPEYDAPFSATEPFEGSVLQEYMEMAEKTERYISLKSLVPSSGRGKLRMEFATELRDFAYETLTGVSRSTDIEAKKDAEKEANEPKMEADEPLEDIAELN